MSQSLFSWFCDTKISELYDISKSWGTQCSSGYYKNNQLEGCGIKDKLIKDDSDSVQDTFFKVLFAQKEREDISRRTKAGLARRIAMGVKLGRKIGGHNSHYKLTGKESLIKTMLQYGYSKAAICRKLKCNPGTLQKHMERMCYFLPTQEITL